jgi:hypothetical protein
MMQIRHLSPTFVLPAQRLPQEPQAGVGPMPWTPKIRARGRRSYDDRFRRLRHGQTNRRNALGRPRPCSRQNM